MRRRHAVIVDDERLARRELRTLLEEAHSAEVHIVGEGASLEEAARIIQATDADLVFLDITLGRESGFDLLASLGADVDVVFVTAHDVHAIRAFEVNALDYLMKPVEPARLALTIQRLESPAPGRAENTRPLTHADRLFLRLNDHLAFVHVADIIAIEAAADSSVVHLTTLPAGARTNKSLREWEQRLPDRHFVRIHRSTMINLDHVARVDEWSHASFHVHMRNLTEPLVMSRRYGARVRSQLG
jgi:two-component system, LytTR family, response regulator